MFFKHFRIAAAWTAILLSPFAVCAQGEDDENFIVPARPSVSEGANVHRAGVVQIETGGNFNFRTPGYRNEQAAPLGVYFAANKRLRLDFEVDSVVSQRNSMFERETGVGDVNLGFKAVARDKPRERLAVAFAYSVKIPAASEEKGLGTGKFDHNLRLILHRSLGKNDFIANFSYLNVGREMSDKRASGAQVILRYERELPRKFGVLTEAFGNTVDEEQPRGLYLLGALTYRVNKRLRFDAGARPGFGRDAPRVGIFAGFSVGIGSGFRLN